MLIMQEISSSDVSSVCSDSYKIDILPLCAEFRFVLGQKGAGFFGVAADFRMPRRMCTAETAGFRQQCRGSATALRCRSRVISTIG